MKETKPAADLSRERNNQQNIYIFLLLNISYFGMINTLYGYTDYTHRGIQPHCLALAEGGC